MKRGVAETGVATGADDPEVWPGRVVDGSVDGVVVVVGGLVTQFVPSAPGGSGVTGTVSSAASTQPVGPLMGLQRAVTPPGISTEYVDPNNAADPGPG